MDKDGTELIHTTCARANRPAEPKTSGDSLRITPVGFPPPYEPEPAHLGPLENGPCRGYFASLGGGRNPLVDHQPKQKAPGVKEDKVLTCGSQVLIWTVVILLAGLVLGLGLGVGLGLPTLNDLVSTAYVPDDSPNSTVTNGARSGSLSTATASISAMPSKLTPLVPSESCKEKKEICRGGSFNPAYYSRKGAFNGTALKLIDGGWTRNSTVVRTLLFQHWTGSIRYKEFTSKGEWIGGTRSEVLVSDAKNGTPISCVKVPWKDGYWDWHLFYVDKSDVLREMGLWNSTNSWEDGPASFSRLGLKVYGQDNAGMQADLLLWENETVGSPIGGWVDAGLFVWYATSNNTLQHYVWHRTLAWVLKSTWIDMPAPGGLLYMNSHDNITYFFMMNEKDRLKLWWQDRNTTFWTKVHDWAIDDVYPDSSLAISTYVYVQMANGEIRGYNVSLAAGNSTIDRDHWIRVDQPSPGLETSITGTRFDSGLDRVRPGSEHWLYQTRGDDITWQFRKDGQTWDYGEIPIPDE